MATTVGRRDFLKLSAIVGGGAGLGLAGLRRLSSDEIQSALAYDSSWTPTTCNMCGGTTGVFAHVAGGRVVKIEPNSSNPIGVCNISTDYTNLKSTGARMCPKGNAAIMSLYDPDRVKTPLRRKAGTARGAGQWDPISYDQAVSEIAQRLGAIKANYGPEKVVWFTEDNNFVPIQQAFCAQFGTPNYLQHSNLCDAARNRAFTLTLGHGRPLPDLRNTKYMLIFGWNPMGAMKWALLPRILNDGLANGAKLVLVDPRCSETADKALDNGGRWLPIRPGTDGALALGIANYIIAQNLYDKNFVANYTVGFDQFKSFVATKTPDWAAGITGISASMIRQVAQELATTKPAVVDAWSGVSHHTNGTDSGRAIACLAALTGQVDVPGGLVLPERPGPKFNIPAVPTANRVDGLGTKYPFGHSSGIYVDARDAMISGQPYQPKAAVFVMQNFVFSVPNQAKSLQALNNMDLVVSVDTHLSETAMMADYVIPGTNFLERYELLPQWVTFKVLSLRQPVVAPVLPGVKPEYEFVRDLARAMGLGGYYPFSLVNNSTATWYEQFLDDGLMAGLGIHLADLKKLEGATYIGSSTRYQKYATDGGFATPSKKFEFYSQQMGAKGLNPLPDYVPPQDRPTSTYPLYLVNWKEALHTHSRTMNNRWLMEFHGQNELWINMSRAQSVGIADGDIVTVENQYAKATAKARLTTRIHPDVVGMTHGFGHWALGPVAKGKGTNDAQFVPGKTDPISGMAAHKDAAVRVYK